MPDEAFANPRIAAIYDAFNSSNADIAFYVGLAGERPLRVLELGSGTGRLTLALAEGGHTVTGVDPARAMLDLARAKPGADRVTWVEAEGQTVSLGAQFDLIVMTGHVFQVFLTDEDVRAVLRNARAHLAPGGRLAFETRNPLARAWEEWNPEATREVGLVEGIGEVEVFYKVVGVTDRFVDFESYNIFHATGERLVSHSRLRFMPQEEVARHLAEAGFTEVDWRGDWRGNRYDDSKREIIAIAR